MLPGLATDDSANRGLRNPEHARQGHLREIAGSVGSANFSNLILRQHGPTVPLSAWTALRVQAGPVPVAARNALWMQVESVPVSCGQPAFHGCIRHVLRGSPDEQMCRIDALGIIAGVADIVTCRDRTIAEHPSDPVRHIELPADIKGSIPVGPGSSLPSPAVGFGALQNLCIESDSVLWGEFRDGTVGAGHSVLLVRTCGSAAGVCGVRRLCAPMIPHAA